MLNIEDMSVKTEDSDIENDEKRELVEHSNNSAQQGMLLGHYF